eukprot:2040754-Heterocapsa_arctica.AAC.1
MVRDSGRAAGPDAARTHGGQRAQPSAHRRIAGPPRRCSGRDQRQQPLLGAPAPSAPNPWHGPVPDPPLAKRPPSSELVRSRG